MVDEIEEVLAPTQCLKQVGWDKVIAQEAILQDVLAFLRRRPRVFCTFCEK